MQRLFDTHPITEERVAAAAELAADAQAADQPITPDPVLLADIQRRLGAAS